MVTSYLGSLAACSCSKHKPKSILRFAIQPRATFLASSRPSGRYPETCIWGVLVADHAAEKSGTRRIRRLCTRLAMTSGGVEKVTVISGRNGGRSRVIIVGLASHGFDRDCHGPTDTDASL